ncbi:MAG: D-2-hydroxyacid dehydrogenase [Gemmatimonadetes bacterium]|nr:D-2-hydroxyacid dehydrogenase [Gemmatimonadota bacterium]
MRTPPSFVLALVLGASAVSAPATSAQELVDCPVCDRFGPFVEELGLSEGPVPVGERPGWVQLERIATHIPPMIEPLREAFPGIEVVQVSARANQEEAVPGVQAFLGICGPRLLETLPDLRWVGLASAGLDDCDPIADELIERGVVVTNMRRVHARQIAEHAIAMSLSFVRDLNRYTREQAGGEWTRFGTPSANLEQVEDKTMLVVGLGGIGTETARRAHALDMRVVATRNSRREGPDYVHYVGLSHELLELAAEADVIVNATPLTPDTRGLFDAEFFRVMKESAYFINVGRGESVVNDDLVAALEAGELAGAGLDVTFPEPLPAGHPLWSLPNVILTPHVAASSDQLFSRIASVMLENVRRYVSGARMLNEVDLARGN